MYAFPYFTSRAPANFYFFSPNPITLNHRAHIVIEEFQQGSTDHLAYYLCVKICVCGGVGIIVKIQIQKFIY